METETNHKPVVGVGKQKRKLRLRGKRWIVAALLLAVAIGWSWWLFGRAPVYNEDKGINTNQYQAVFLTNGQVYFGKLSHLNHRYVTITDIYYLQVQSSSASADSKLQDASSSTDTGTQVSLAKLGSELHGPEDKMYIASDQMLFWENLKNDSKVVQAIDKYQNQ